MLLPCGVGTSSATLVQFAVSKSWTPVSAVKLRAKRIFTASRTAWSFGASAITPFTTAACRCGSSKTIAVHFVNRNGPFSEWANSRIIHIILFAFFLLIFTYNEKSAEYCNYVFYHGVSFCVVPVFFF